MAPVWGVMQLGVIGAVPLVALLALLTRRIRLAAYAALAGSTIYLIAKLVKEFVQRGRPQTLLDNVYIFDIPDRGLGYVSGHSAVAVALATVASAFLGRRARRVAWTLAGLVCVARIYVGSHLPLDVVGGAALGWDLATLLAALDDVADAALVRTTAERALGQDTVGHVLPPAASTPAASMQTASES